jgi:hypothetical protein
MNIETVFATMKKKTAQVLERSILEMEALADMFALVEKWRLPVVFVFVPSRFTAEVVALAETLSIPTETATISHLGNFWYADWYAMEDLDAFYAVTTYLSLDKEGAVAKLVIGG